jgi:outer membrane protein OmpA-like peptidoglycan-associated protein
LSAAALGLVFLASPVLAAGPQYTANELVNFLVKAKDAGPTRGICVGTAEECRSNAVGFDMMVNFELNSATLTPQAMDNLTQVSRALADPRLKGVNFEVDGYTDATGTTAFNNALSERRAQSVRDYLVSQGIPAVRLDPQGFGEASPRATNPYDPVNRRVEIRLSAQQ